MSHSRFLPPTIKQQIASTFEEEEEQLRAKGIVEFIRSFQGDMNKLEYFMNKAKKARVIGELAPLPKTAKGRYAKHSISIRLQNKGQSSTIFPGPGHPTRRSMNLDTQLSLGTGDLEKLKKYQESPLMKSQDYYHQFIHRRLASSNPKIEYVNYDENKKEDFQEKVNSYLKKLKKEEEEKEAALQTEINERIKRDKELRSSRQQSREPDLTPVSASTSHYLGIKGLTSEQVKEEVGTPGRRAYIGNKMPFPKTFKLPDINPMTRRLDPNYTPSQMDIYEATPKGKMIIKPALLKSSPKAGVVERVSQVGLPPLELKGSELASTPGQIEGNKSRGTGLSLHQNVLSNFGQGGGASHFFGKRLTIDRDSSRFHELFRTICNQKISYKHCKVSRTVLRNYLAKRYDKKVVEQMLRGYFDLSHAYTFDQFCTHVDAFLANEKTHLLRFVFQGFDTNNDGMICEDDIWHVLQNVSQDAFQKAFYPDISLVIEMINQKQSNIDSTASKVLGMDPKKLALFKREATRKEMIKSIKDLKRIGLVPERERGSSINFEEFCSINFPHSGIPCVLDDFIKSISNMSPIALSQTLHGLKALSEDRVSGYMLNENDEKEIEKYKEDFDEEKNEFDSLKSIFFKLCAANDGRGVPKDEKRAYITKEKLQENLHFALKIENEFLSNRLYDILSENQADAKIMLPQFLRVLRPMLFGSDEQKQQFSFILYDRDNDGIINSTDMLKLQETLAPNCALMIELKLIIEEYTDKNIWVKDRKKKIYVSPYYFQKLVERSVLTEELTAKLLGHWKKEDISCFADQDETKTEEKKGFLNPSSIAVSQRNTSQNILPSSSRELESKK